MKPAAPLLAAALALAATAGVAARYSTGRFASWVPHAGLPQTAVAALNQVRAPVVLYDPALAQGVPDALFNFLLLREEYVAIAARQLLMLRRAPKAWSERRAQPYLVVDERLVYDHVRVGDSLGPLAFDCLAYGALGTAERHAFYLWAHARTASGQSLPVGSGRSFSRQDLRFVASDACAGYHLAARAKMGINSVLRGGETRASEPGESAGPRAR